jgi:hypothetical protein
MDGNAIEVDIEDDRAAQQLTQVFSGQLQEIGGLGDIVQAAFAYWIFVQELQVGSGEPFMPSLEPTLD